MNVRFYSQAYEGRGVVVAVLDPPPLHGMFGWAREKFTLDQARDLARRLEIAIAEAESIDATLTRQARP